MAMTMPAARQSLVPGLSCCAMDVLTGCPWLLMTRDVQAVISA